MGHHFSLDEETIDELVAKNGIEITDEVRAMMKQLAENGGYEIMTPEEAGIESADALRARIEQSKQETRDADFEPPGLDT